MVKEKTIIETLINTTAIALTATGTTWTINGFQYHGLGCALIAFGIVLEFFKYWGRSKNLW